MSDDRGADICQNRHRNNPESNAAFRKIEPHIAAQLVAVAEFIAAHPGGLTAQEIEVALNLNRSSVSARCAELKKAGVIGPKPIGTGPKGEVIYERRRTRSGCTSAVLVWSG